MRALLPMILLTASFGVGGGCKLATPLRPSAASSKVAAEVQLQRPLVILGGWRDPGILHAKAASSMGRRFGKEQVLTVDFFNARSFADGRQKLIDAVQKRWPSPDPDKTVEVDVVAHSMGGLVARYAAVPAGAPGFSAELVPDGRSLRIANLFTIATPHRGARLAPLAFWDRTARAMVPGSEFLQALDAGLAHAPYRMQAYAIEGDVIVGSEQSTPVESGAVESARTFPGRFLMPSHLNAMNDPRVIADIVRRLQDGR